MRTKRIRVPEGQQPSFFPQRINEIMMLLKLESRRQRLLIITRELANEGANQASSVHQPDYLHCQET